jgi:hypothetical protein
MEDHHWKNIDTEEHRHRRTSTRKNIDTEEHRHRRTSTPNNIDTEQHRHRTTSTPNNISNGNDKRTEIPDADAVKACSGENICDRAIRENVKS